MEQRIAFGCALAAAALAAAPMTAQAQAKFERPVRLVVPFAPGGVNDIIGRRYAQELTRVIGQNVIVDNRGGAGGSIGAAEVARAKPDGYTLLVANTSTHVINPVALPNAGYDPIKDFSPIAVITIVPTGVAVHPSMPTRTLKQLVAFAKANPGKLSFGSAGTGSVTHMTGELFKKVGGGLNIVHIPYKGAGPGLADLVAGHIPMYTPTISPAPLSYHKEGRIRMLSVNSEKRLEAAPDIPTSIEAGMPEMVVYSFSGILASPNSPKAMIDTLHQATLKVMADRDMQQFVKQAGAEPVTDSSPEKMTRFLQTEAKRWTPIIRQMNVKE